MSSRIEKEGHKAKGLEMGFKGRGELKQADRQRYFYTKMNIHVLIQQTYVKYPKKVDIPTKRK